MKSMNSLHVGIAILLQYVLDSSVLFSRLEFTSTVILIFLSTLQFDFYHPTFRLYIPFYTEEVREGFVELPGELGSRDVMLVNQDQSVERVNNFSDIVAEIFSSIQFNRSGITEWQESELGTKRIERSLKG